MELIFATGNAGKVREAQQICDRLAKKWGINLTIVPMPDKVDIPETGDSYEENALQKARFVWDKYHKNCIADDSGMEVEALDGAPGIYTARYCDRDFADGMDKLLYELDRKQALAPEQRKATFECCLTVIIDGTMLSFRGTSPGRISLCKCGSAGFGFDPVFMPDATPGLCMAELPEEQKNLISHRGLAFEKLFRYLAEEK